MQIIKLPPRQVQARALRDGDVHEEQGYRRMGQQYKPPPLSLGHGDRFAIAQDHGGPRMGSSLKSPLGVIRSHISARLFARSSVCRT